MENENYWRNTAEPARFFIVDARAALFVPIMLFYLRPKTVGLFLLVMGVLWLVERRGYSVPVAIRMLMLWLGLGFKTHGRIRSYTTRFMYRFNKRN